MERKFANEEVTKLNQAIRQLIADKNSHDRLKNNWRTAAINLPLDDEQKAYLDALPNRSVDTIQAVIGSIIVGGGSLAFERDGLGKLVLMAKDVHLYAPQVNLKICSFDGVFQNCRWFPR